MGRFLTNLEDIKNTIKWADLFDLQIIGMPNEKKIEETDNGLITNLITFHTLCGGFSGSVSEIGFGDNNDIFVLYNDFDKGKILDSINDELLSDGIRLVITDRDGTSLGNYEFNGCKLISKVPIILGYDNTYVVQRHPYILRFTYNNIYKIIS